MNVKPISTLSPFNINTATEAREDSKNRQNNGRENKNRRGPGTAFVEPTLSDNAPSTESQAPDPSQIVDTATYLELLSHQPKPEIRQIRGFIKKPLHSPKIDEISATSDSKKLNKSL